MPKKRILRIYPGLWVQLALGIILATVFGAITPSVITSVSFISWVIAQTTCVQFYNPEFLRGFGLGVLNGSLWTIPVELGFYLSLPVLYALIMNRTSRQRGDICLALIAIVSFAYWFYLSIYADLHSNLAKLQMVTPLPHLHMFLVGVLLQRHFEQLLPYLENQAPYWFAAFAILHVLAESLGKGRTVSVAPIRRDGGGYCWR